MKKFYFSLIALFVGLCASAQLYVCGGGDGLAWEPANPLEVTADADGNYTFTVTNLTAFKMSTSKGTWNQFNANAIGTGSTLAPDKEYSISGWGENQTLPWTGDWTVKVYANKTKMYLTTTTPNPGAPSIYMRGDMNSWGSPDAWKFSTVDGVVYELKNVTITSSQNFKIADANWGNVNYGGATNMKVNTEYLLSYNSNTNCKLAANFTGNVIFNLDTKKVVFDDGNYNPNPGPAYKEAYLVGANYGDWSVSADYKMSTEDGVVYTITVPNLSGEWKIWDGSWNWSWGKGANELQLNKTGEAWFNSSANYALAVDHEVTIKLTVVEGSAAAGSATASQILVYDAEYDPNAPDTNKNTVYFDNTNSEWETVYAYVWNGASQNANFPGVAMTKGENNVWSYEIETIWEPAQVIFSNGAGQQTDDLTFENEKTYSMPVPTAYSVSFDNGLTAWETVYAYVYNADKYVAAWPGVEMTKGEGTVWTYDFKTYIDPANIIFSDGQEGGAQTEDLAFEAGKVYGDPAPIVVEEVQVKWNNNDANYTNPYANWSAEMGGEVTSVAMTEIMEEVETPDVPEQKIVTYNFSDFARQDYTENTKVGDLTIYATASAKVTIDGSNKTIDGVAYTQRLKFGGTANIKTPARVIGFPVDGACTIVVAATSSGSDERKVNVYDAAGTVIETIDAPSGTINVASVAYTGEAGEIFIGSANSGANIYFVRVEYPVAATPAAIEYVGTGIWEAQLPAEAKYVYFTDGASADRGDNKLFAVEDEKTYTPETEGVTGVEAVAIDANAAAVYYNLQGVRVANPAAGQVYIKVNGKKATKVQF